MPDKKDVSRRKFLELTALGAGAATLGGLSITPGEAHAAEKNRTWDRQADVVVVGCGAAGAAAAIAARDEGASVLILEKGETGGGSTYYSGGFFVSPRDVDGAVRYLMECARAADREHFDLDRDGLKDWATEAVQNESWIRGLGGDPFVTLKGWYDLPGASSFTSCRLRGDPTGVGLWKTLSRALSARKIDVVCNSRGIELLTREAAQKTRGVEVLGIVAEVEGRKMTVRANHALVITCGGFDYDESMKKNFLMPYPQYSVGHPGNTGDAVKLCAKAGAGLWHMNSAPGTLCHKIPEIEVAYPSLLQMSAAGRSVIFVNRHAKRFTNEETTSYDAAAKSLYPFDPVTCDFPNIPCWCVFDEKSRLKGPAGLGVPIGRPVFDWSRDNSVEIAKGWILRAETLEELARKMGVDAVALKETVSTFNFYCAGKTDPDFGRKAGLIALDTPPFHALKGYPGIWATAGGPRINAKAQVLDVHGLVIPRLYAAGSASTYAFAHLYPLSGTAIGDCFAMGRIAGRNAGREKPWRP